MQERSDDTKTQITFFSPPPAPALTQSDFTSSDSEPHHTNIYTHTRLAIAPGMDLTLGASFDAFHSPIEDRSRFNPKLGLIWSTLSGTTLRTAYFETIKRPLASNQTVEPTQVAGFNQFFDDVNGTRTRRYGVALEQQFSHSVFGGIEASWRDLEIPIESVTTGQSRSEDQNERGHRAYLYAAITDDFALSGEYFHERFDRSFSASTLESRPTEITTHRFPATLSNFHPTGLLASVRAQRVMQDVAFADGAGGEGSQDDRFWIVDVSAGCRLPKRHGLLRNNLFDKDFRFQDTNFQTAQSGIPRFLPDRTLFGRLELSF